MISNYKGKILISTPDRQGGIFSRAVVLIIRHDGEGAFGLILNRPNNKMFVQTPDRQLSMDLYEGGPVDRMKLFFITKNFDFIQNAEPINRDFVFTEDVENMIISIAENRFLPTDFKAFSGYSGWSAGQLEDEITRKMWTVTDSYTIDYAARHDQNLWKKVLQNLGGEHLLWANAPEDVTLN